MKKVGSGDERRGVVSFRLAVVNNKVYSQKTLRNNRGN